MFPHQNIGKEDLFMFANKKANNAFKVYKTMQVIFY